MVAGGDRNTASGAVAFMGGGWGHDVAGYRSVVLGGSSNTAGHYDIEPTSW